MATTADDEVSQSAFCALNEQTFDLVLSFMSNQTLHRLQMVTGVRYTQCEPDFTTLAQFCCPCENDNPKVVHGLCLDCERRKNPHFQPLIDKQDALGLYDVFELRGIHRVRQGRRKLYARVDLDKHMMERHGSKVGWLRALSTTNRSRKDKSRAVQRIQNRGQCGAFLQSSAENFATYVRKIEPDLGYMTVSVLQQSSERYAALKAALDARGLVLRSDSKLSSHFILTGLGEVADVVDTMEEMKFLYSHTNYVHASENLWEAERAIIREWYPPDEFRRRMEAIRGEVRHSMCVDYLQDNKGLSIPHKWELCRSRYNEALAVGADPHCHARYIYEAKGRKPRAPGEKGTWRKNPRAPKKPSPEQ